ncbi:ATP-binding protein [Chitinilyticum piscinae]|uniref:histidine kinase n=1 Tax=Chitinilyticum piscinae TaxID=2866724 RepID=A0A8J7K2N5_9NEIS|nr:ATP-binding protein [Chitinilyticum piscinae]MBE9610282.1 response regulator [Chitinilyticum piscinae]
MQASMIQGLAEAVRTAAPERLGITLVEGFACALQARRVVLLFEDQGRLRARAQFVQGQAALEYPELQGLDTFYGLPAQALQNQLQSPALTMLASAAPTDELWVPAGTQPSPRYQLILPLVDEGRLIAVLFAEAERMGDFETLRASPVFLGECAALAAVLVYRRQQDEAGRFCHLEAGQLHASLSRIEDERLLLQRLGEVTLELTRAADLDQLYHRAVSLAISQLDIDRMGLFEYDADSGDMLGTYGTDNEGRVTDERWYRSACPVHDMFGVARARPGEVVVKEDAALYYDKQVVGRGWNALVALHHEGEILGWIACDNFIRHRPMPPGQREVIKLFAAILSQLMRSKRFEAGLRQANQQLSLQTEELRIARDAAEEASRAKSEFLATISHEIRTPLNGVLGFAQLLAASPLNHEQREQLASIRHSGEALLALINDLLDFAKIEAGKLELDHLPFDLVQVTREACRMLAPRAAERRIEFLLDIAPGVPVRVLGDALRYRQIVLNLLANAVKFTEAGGVRVSVRWRSGCIELEVRDTGIGIAAERQQRLFERFYQADSSSTRRFGGTGLGLAICRLLCELMRGHITVESAPGRGSTFCCVLPLEAEQFAPVDADARAAAFLQGRRIGWVGDPAWRDERLLQVLRAAGVVLLDLAATTELPLLDLLIIDESPRAVVSPLLDWSGAPPLLYSGWHAPAGWVEGSKRRLLLKPVFGLDTWLQALHQLLGGTGPVLLQEPIPVVATLRGQVLVVEDNPLNQRVVAIGLQRLGCEVALAANGLEALEKAAENQFDLILMDCQMPVMDGLEATRRLRQQPQTATLPIIALTANALQESEQACLDAGMDDFLTKPINFDLLRQVLARYLV